MIKIISFNYNMNKLIIIFLLISFFFTIIKTNELNETKKEKIERNENKDNNKDDSKEKEKENANENNEEEENQKEEEEQSGFYISERVFEEKLKAILEEKNLKPKKKITKKQLRTIFGIIYKKEDKPGEEKGVDPETGLTPEEQNKQYMDSIFNEVTKSLDYDDKIRVKEIKDWIHPIRVQEAYAELLQGLAETMGYL